MENRMIHEVLDNFEALGLFGAAIMVHGRIEAFTVAERLNDDTAVIHIEKANNEFKGIYQAINNFFCSEGLAEYRFVNREQDEGKPGLRKAKLSYRPFMLAEKYNLLQANPEQM
jgi:hypothetical protein